LTYRLDPAGERATGGWGHWVGEEPAAQSGWNGTGGGVGSRDEWT